MTGALNESAQLKVAEQMAKSKYEYVKRFETQDLLLPQTFFVVRVDGRAFSRFTGAHSFEKPNDAAALNLMNEAALEVCTHFNDVFLAFGQSDEYSFAFGRACTLYKRRREKILSAVVSVFSSAYTRHFPRFKGELRLTPSFDARIVCLPSVKSLRDYFAWRQVDTHINNLYNTCFWALVKEKQCTHGEAEEALRHTLSDFKNELLFSQFGRNYNNEEPMFRKGSAIVRAWCVGEGKAEKAVQRTPGKVDEPRKKLVHRVLHEDIIGDLFWEEHVKHLLEAKAEE